ncbi:ribonuclease III [Sulfuriroseicoccus oceanibius]|uniref:Ribonuclease 3 n=1 Tax=Sulfuriroseicoccus oceanibius TaxID=2707525 RepID=A0A6B3LB38_9BACT|nr:ribonuclease III [Sulfuriroseicoccus oceanibius]QQL45271.1 ribonuclease III [Sulfuriroseicoccus oceanibius]
MKTLEQQLGYKFRNSLLLGEALTHPSLAYESIKPHFDNQRLEFLGDAVLQLVLTEELYRRFPQFREGRLTKLRARLVSRSGLRVFADRISLGDFVLLGKGEEANGGRQRSSTLADAYEALIGAVYLDSSLDAVREVIVSICRPELDAISDEEDQLMETNPKGELQEVLQSIGNAGPSYVTVAESGPDHDKTFEAEVRWNDMTLGSGKGPSKKIAETDAARSALELRVWESEQASEAAS